AGPLQVSIDGWREADRLVVVRYSQVEQLLAAVGQTPVEVRIRVLREEADGSVVIGHRLIVPVEVAVGIRSPNVGVAVVGVEMNGLGAVCDGLLVVPPRVGSLPTM